MKLRTPLSKYQEFQAEHPLAHELPYWDFLAEDQSLVLSEGTLVQGFRLQGLAIETLNEEQMNQITLQLRGVLTRCQTKQRFRSSWIQIPTSMRS